MTESDQSKSVPAQGNSEQPKVTNGELIVSNTWFEGFGYLPIHSQPPKRAQSKPLRVPDLNTTNKLKNKVMEQNSQTACTAPP